MSQHVLALSYGKDSLACLGAIKQLGLPLDRIIHAEVWATETVHGDFPEMVAFKQKADKIIKEHYGIDVEHVYATINGRKRTFEDVFYSKRQTSRRGDTVGKQYGWPFQRGPWCNSRLKVGILNKAIDSDAIQYLGIAVDEPERIDRHTKDGIILPLVQANWDEAYCRKWCEDNDLLSPIYNNSARGGCWFCHNQGVEQLRLLRHNYPDLWALMLKWDVDSPVSFKPDGHSVQDYERRFQMEDNGLVPMDKKFRWKMIV